MTHRGERDWEASLQASGTLQVCPASVLVSDSQANPEKISGRIVFSFLSSNSLPAGRYFLQSTGTNFKVFYFLKTFCWRDILNNLKEQFLID